MAYINAANSADFVRVLVKLTTAEDVADLSTADFLTSGDPATGVLEVPALQDITITNTPSTFRWKQLDTASEKVVTSVSSNSISGNLVLDPDTFFGTTGSTGTTAPAKGIFNMSNAKDRIAVMIGLSGVDTGDKYIMAIGYFSSVAPAVSADSPVWVSPIGVEIDGDYKAGEIA